MQLRISWGFIITIVVTLAVATAVLYPVFVNPPSHILEYKLRMAAFNGNLPEVRHLLAIGADPNHMDEASRTAISEAVYGDHKDIVVVLIGAHADPSTGLSAAVHSRNPDMLRLLIAGGADCRSNQGSRALKAAVDSDPPDMAHILRQAGATLKAD